MKFLNKKYNNLRLFKEHAFTLIELIISIVIAGILSSISLTIFTEYKDKAYQTELTLAMKDLATASEATYMELEAALSAVPEGGPIKSSFYGVGSSINSKEVDFVNTFNLDINIGPELLSHLTKSGNIQFSMSHWRADFGSIVHLWRTYYAFTCKTRAGSANFAIYQNVENFTSRPTYRPNIFFDGKSLLYDSIYGVGGSNCH